MMISLHICSLDSPGEMLISDCFLCGFMHLDCFIKNWCISKIKAFIGQAWTDFVMYLPTKTSTSDLKSLAKESKRYLFFCAATTQEEGQVRPRSLQHTTVLCFSLLWSSYGFNYVTVFSSSFFTRCGLVLIINSSGG